MHVALGLAILHNRKGECYCLYKLYEANAVMLVEQYLLIWLNHLSFVSLKGHQLIDLLVLGHLCLMACLAVKCCKKTFQAMLVSE